MLISLAYPFMKVYTFANGATGFRGQILNVQQDISILVKHFNEVHSLLLNHSKLPILLIRKPNVSLPTGNDQLDCFKVHRSVIWQVLCLLKLHHPLHRDMQINAQVLESLRDGPNGGSIMHRLS
jgi:hypothetical protein